MQERQEFRHDQRRLANVDNVGILMENFATERTEISEQLMENMSADFKKTIERGKMQMKSANQTTKDKKKVNKKKDIKIDATDLFSVDTTNLPSLLYTYPDLNEIQRFRLRIAVRAQLEKRMEKFKRKLDKQLRASNNQGFISSSSNATRRRTALMVYRQRNIDMEEMEKEAYKHLVKSTKFISQIFQPDPKDKLNFEELSAKDKWKRVFKEKHWKAYTKDPKARTRKDKNGGYVDEDDYHNFRINLPLRKPNIKKWAHEHSIIRGKDNKTIRLPLPPEDEKEEEEADNEGKTKQQVSPKIKESNIVKNRKKTHYETHGRYLYNTQYLPEEYIPNLKSSINVLNHYGGLNDEKGKEKALLIKKIARNRHKKFGTLTPEHTLIAWDIKKKDDDNSRTKSFQSSKFMSPDLVVKPFEPIDRMDDHVQSIPALPMTSFASSETFNMQNRRRANSMGTIGNSMIIEPVLKKKKTWEEKHLLVSSSDNENDGESEIDEDNNYSYMESKEVNLSTMLSEHNHNSEKFLDELHKRFNAAIKDEDMDYKYQLLETHLEAAKVTNPLWKMKSQDHFKQKPEFGEYPIFLYKLSGASENEIYNFRNHLQNIIFKRTNSIGFDDGEHFFQGELHRTAIESVTYSLMVTVSTHKKMNENKFISIVNNNYTNQKTGGGKKAKKIGSSHNKHIVVPLNPVTLGRFKDAIKLLELNPTVLLKTICKYTNPKFSPWATLASEIWLRCGRALKKLKKSCKQYIYMRARMPKVKRRKHMFVLDTQLSLIHKEKEECDCLKFFIYLSFSDYIVAGLLQETVKNEFAKLEEEDIGGMDKNDINSGGKDDDAILLNNNNKNIDSIDVGGTRKGGILSSSSTSPEVKTTKNKTLAPPPTREFIVNKAEEAATHLEEKSIETLMGLS